MPDYEVKITIIREVIYDYTGIVKISSKLEKLLTRQELEFLASDRVFNKAIKVKPIPNPDQSDIISIDYLKKIK